MDDCRTTPPHHPEESEPEVTPHEPILEDMSDERLAALLRSTEATINRGMRDPLHGRPSRETVLRRLAHLRENLDVQIDAAADVLVRVLARSEASPEPGTLTAYAGLRALAVDDAAWQALSARIAAPVDSHSSDPFGHPTDEAAATDRSERAQKIAEAQELRPLILAVTKKRRDAADRAADERANAERRRIAGQS